MEVTLWPGAIQAEFIKSKALENCIMGPRGEGKTEGGIMRMTRHANLQDRTVRPVPYAIIRDTWSNLERTTLQSFLVPRPGSFAAAIRSRLKVQDGGRHLTLPGVWEAWLFGIDSWSDLNRLQSMQLGGLWLEEAAPAAIEDIGVGISEETWLIGISSLRHPCNKGRNAQVTMNYPDEDHWTWIRFHDEVHPNRALFRIPKGENKAVDDEYRKNMAEAMAKRPDLAVRLVEGKPGMVVPGEAVTPEYDENCHRSDRILEYNRSLTGFRFWDGGLHPACVIAQIQPSGRFYVLDTVRAPVVGMGMRQFIGALVKPLLAAKYDGWDKAKWRDLGDPSLNDREQSDSAITVAGIINGELGTSFEGGEMGWEARKQAIKDLLLARVEKQTMLLISKNDTIMHRALKGGWHYHKDPSGKVLRDMPVKDVHSHPTDALCHGLARIFGYGVKPLDQVYQKYKDRRAIAKSYAVKAL